MADACNYSVAKGFLKIIWIVEQKLAGPDLSGSKKQMWGSKTNEREELAFFMMEATVHRGP